MTKYTIVVYNLLERDTKVKIATVDTLHAARVIMSTVASKNWHMNRRPDVHTIGDLCMTVIKD